MTQKEKISKLVYCFDLSTLGIDATPPELCKDADLSDAAIAQDVPTHEERAATIAWDACYLKYLNEKPDGTLEEFDANLNMDTYEQVTRDIQSKLASTIDASGLREFHRVKYLNLTKVDPNRQIDES